MRITKAMLKEQEKRDAILESNQSKCRNIICQKMNIVTHNNGDMFLYDEMTNSYTQMRFSGRNVKFPIPGLLYDDERDVIFDPYNNIKLMISLVFMYVDKLMYNPKEVMSISISTTKFHQLGNAKIQFMDGSEITGHDYFRDSLKYLDLIFIMDDSNPFEFKQLREIDLDAEDIIDRRTMENYKKRKGLL